MDFTFGRNCAVEGKTFVDGSYFCDQEKCMECNDGVWEDQDEWQVLGSTNIEQPPVDYTADWE